jgi:glycosyltransferase involved in cell wall biosynthesis
MLSLVIPVYKNEASLPELVEELKKLAGQLTAPLEVVFVVDGSPDNSFVWLREHLAGLPFSAQLLLHSRNFGSFAAIRTGLRQASGDYFAVLAADLQEPVSLVADFHRALAGGDADVAIGLREGRSDPFFSRLFSGLFWWSYRKLVFPDIPPGGVDVFACNRACRDELLKLEELNSSLVGLLFWVGFKRKLVPYSRAERKHGKSAWTFGRKLKYLLDSVYSFSDLPIRMLKWVGMLALVLAMVVGLVVLVTRLTGGIPVPGYTPIVLAIVFFGGLNALGLGVLGEYVWRTFENTKRRPLAIVKSAQTFEARHEQRQAVRSSAGTL